jgi:hypothetical protein
VIPIEMITMGMTEALVAIFCKADITIKMSSALSVILGDIPDEFPTRELVTNKILIQFAAMCGL